MAQRPQRPCRATGCRALHRNAHGYCDAHAHLVKVWTKTPEQSGRGGRPWRRLRDQILERDGYLCQCEGCQRRALPLVAHEVDHIKPISQGGTDDPGNLRAINRDCHRAKSQAEAQRARRPGR
ncbi:HNH endonuclease [Neopusillimonas aromaticivorans]|uniref:HNH endonuclease n=1 Tax=Neopusillimonas aromaticivorans TaxID=2979868 RepID=UPI00259A20B1|nr:HNH endonuclease [Neopusillimonas aromaticivorans]WJJ93429.1 HNH endonuclease [Neopusillimonas aromaticivorans]